MATPVKLTPPLAQDLGMGWYSVELYDDGGPITPDTARAFLVRERDYYARDVYQAPYPFAAILVALDESSAAERAEWLEHMCAAAREEVEVGGLDIALLADDEEG